MDKIKKKKQQQNIRVLFMFCWIFSQLSVDVRFIFV